MNRSFVKTLLAAGALPCILAAQNYTVKTIAGGVPDRNGSRAASIYLYSPEAVGVDSAGNVYVADTGGRRIWKIDAGTGIATVVSGNGLNSTSNDPSTSAKATWGAPAGILVDSAGNILVSDRAGAFVRKIDVKTGAVTTFAGISSGRYSGDGGLAINAALNQPRGLAMDTSGNVYIADSSNHRIRKVDTNGIITSVAGVTGSGYAGDGEPAKFARLNAPEDVAVDPQTGNIYIADTANHRIRMIDTRGIISTVVGNGLTTTTTTTVTASNTTGSTPTGTTATTATASSSAPASGSAMGGSGLTTGLNSPSGLAFYKGQLYIADRGNNRLLVYDPADQSVDFAAVARNATFTSNPALFSSPSRIAIDNSGRIYVAESPAVPSNNTSINPTPSNQVKVYDPAANSAAVFAGAPHGATDNVAATSAVLSAPFGVAVDSKGVVYFSDPPMNRVYKIMPDGNVYVVAGTGAAGSNASAANVGDGGPAATARLNSPRGLAVDSGGKLYIADAGTHRVRVVDQGGVITTLAGGNGSGLNGDTRQASTAQLNTPSAVAVDQAGNVYIADTGNNLVRKISADGNISTVAGRYLTSGATFTVVSGTGGDGGKGTDSTLNGPLALAIDPSGANLYILDSGNGAARQLNLSSGNIVTVAGTNGTNDSDETNIGGAVGATGLGNVGTRLRFRNPVGLAVDNSGGLWISDTNNNRIRRVDLKTLLVTRLTAAGPSGPSLLGSGFGLNFSGDGGAIANAQVATPAHMAVDSAGNVYLAEQGNAVIREFVVAK